MKKLGKLFAVFALIVSLTAIFGVSTMQASAATSITKVTVSAIKDQVYTGKAIKPSVTVKYKSTTLRSGTHYTVSYSGNTKVGIATVTLKGKGSYTGTKSVKFNIVPAAVTNLKVSSPKQTSGVITFSASKGGATGYQVWVYNSKSASYTQYKTITGRKLTVSGLSAGTSTAVRVRPYKKLSSKTIYGPYCTKVYIKTVCADVKGLKQSAATSSTISCKWNKVTGASGYYVYTSNLPDGKFKKSTLCKSNSFKITGLKPATTTYVYVRAFRTIDGVEKYASPSQTVAVMTMPSGKITGLTADSVSYNAATLSWSEMKDVSGYAVYVLSGDEWKLKCLSSTNSKKITSLASCKEYTFKVYPYIGSDSAPILGTACSPVTVATTPKNITGLAFDSATDTTVTIKWAKATEHKKYQIYLLNNATGKYAKYQNVSTTSITVSGLNPDTEYSLRVRGYYVAASGTAVYGKFTDIKAKTDNRLVDSIKVTSPVTMLAPGKKTTLSATVLPAYAEKKAVKWTSSDTKIATVGSLTGIVTGVKEGKVTITATATDGTGKKGTYSLKISVGVTKIKLQKSTVTLGIGENFAMTYEVFPANASNKAVSFKSSNSTVAKVDSYGYVSALKAGTANITVTAKDGSGIKAVYAVTVKKISVSAVAIPEAITIYAGQSYTFLPAFTPANATNKGFTLKSANTSCVTVSGTTIKGVKATPEAVLLIPARPAKITLTTADGSKTATCMVTVVAASKRVAVTGISIMSLNSVWYPGTQGRLSAITAPTDATNTAVAWSSSDTNVAKIDASGNVLCVSCGTTTITATSKDNTAKTATYKLTVQEKISVTGIQLSETSIDPMVSGSLLSLKATLKPSNASEKGVEWTSSNPKIASVTSSGTVSAIAEGSTIITATSKDGGFKATCFIKVKNRGVYITPGTFFDSLKQGDKVQLSASVVSTAVNKDVTWQSFNTDVAQVDAETGLVTIVGNGSAHIAVTSLGDRSLFNHAIVSTDKYTLPTVTSAEAYYKKVSDALNKVKKTETPAYSVLESTEFTDYEIKDIPEFGGQKLLDEAMIMDLFSSFEDTRTATMPKLYDRSPENTAYKRYISNLPVKDKQEAMQSAVTDYSFIDAAKSTVTDNGDTTYAVKLVFKKEVLASLPTSSQPTNHGKAFDILTKEYMDKIVTMMNSFDMGQTAGMDVPMEIKIGNVKTTYNDCSITVYLDKLTDRAIKSVHNMNVEVYISDFYMTLLIPGIIDSDVVLGVNVNTKADYRYPSWEK